MFTFKIPGLPGLPGNMDLVQSHGITFGLFHCSGQLGANKK